MRVRAIAIDAANKEIRETTIEVVDGEYSTEEAQQLLGSDRVYEAHTTYVGDILLSRGKRITDIRNELQHGVSLDNDYFVIDWVPSRSFAGCGLIVGGGGRDCAVTLDAVERHVRF
jgi:hypothetical protein